MTEQLNVPGIDRSGVPPPTPEPSELRRLSGGFHHAESAQLAPSTEPCTSGSSDVGPQRLPADSGFMRLPEQLREVSGDARSQATHPTDGRQGDGPPLMCTMSSAPLMRMMSSGSTAPSSELPELRTQRRQTTPF